VARARHRSGVVVAAIPRFEKRHVVPGWTSTADTSSSSSGSRRTRAKVVLRRRRSRLGEPTVRIELVVIDSNGQLGKELLRRQASAVKEALQWFADHPPTDEPDHHDDTETEAT
jgi:hypothetical protein